MYNIKKLKNGLRLITAPIKGTKTVTVLVMVGTGSKYENRKNNGISHFLEHMFFKGTTKWPTALALASELDGLGAEYNAFTAKEYTGYWIKADISKIEKSLEIVSEMLLNSKLLVTEINKEKGTIVEEMNMYLDNPMMHIEDIFENCLYGDTPAGWDTIGTKDNILGFNREDFISYLNSQYSVHNTFICIAGNLPAQLPYLVGKYFDKQQFSRRGKDFSEKQPVAEKQTEPAMRIIFKQTDQAHLSLGVRGYDYVDKDRNILRLLSIILGGSMSSRMFINVRERQGLAYYVRTDTEAYTDCGYLTTRAGVPINKIEKAIEIILREYKKVKTAPVPEKELRRAKDILIGRMNIQLESSDDLANWYGRQSVLLDAIKRTKKITNEPRTPEKFLREIEKITTSDIRRIARKLFINEGLNLAIIGPYKNSEIFKKLLRI